MTPQEFREAAHDAVDWVADYLENAGGMPVFPSVEPGDLVRSLPEQAPEQGEPFDRIMRDFRRQIVPASTLWNHPRFHAYFSVSASPEGIIGELLTAALNPNGMVWRSSPACTELEQVTLGWIRQWLGLPPEWFGVIFDTASTSTMHAIAAARECIDPEARIRGGSQNLVLYTSEQAHSSVEKGAIATGIGQRNVRKIAVDDAFRLRPDALEEAIKRDVDAGLTPFCAVPTIGTTSTTSIDPVAKVCEIAARHDMWIHVDAAYGGAVCAVRELRHILDGIGSAHSLVMNPHKWFFTPIDVSVLYTRRPEILRRAFSLVPEYLRTSEDERAVNFMDYGVPLGRRFRSLKLWFVLRAYGREGIGRVIRSHIYWAQELGEQIAAHPDFELCAPVPLSLVCFRARGSDERNRLLLERLNASGLAFLSHTVLNGRFVIRLAIGNLATTRDDVQMVWQHAQATAAQIG